MEKQATLRHNFCSELSEDTIKMIEHSKRIPPSKIRTRIDISPRGISLNENQWLHVVAIEKNKLSCGSKFVTLRIIGLGGGLDILVPIENELANKKYIDLRNLIRNKENVFVTFKGLHITNSANSGLIICADDYKVQEQIDKTLPTIIL